MQPLLRNFLIVLVALLSVFSVTGFSFSDDFQNYNSVADAAFTSNYAVFIVGGDTAAIAQAPADSLSLHIATVDNSSIIFINSSRLSVAYPFTFSYTVRAGGEVGGLDVYFYLNNSDTVNDITQLRGYHIRINASNYVGLYRFTPSSSVLLNSSYSPQFNYAIDNLISVSMDSSKHIHFYINAVEYLIYYDTTEIYLSGTIAFGATAGSTTYSNSYFDNLVSEAASGIWLQDWEVVAFPQGITNYFGVGTKDASYCDTAWLDNTEYGARFSPCIRWFVGGYPTQNHYVQAFAIKFRGSYLTQTSLLALNVTSLYLVESSSLPNNCFHESGGATDFDLYNSQTGIPNQYFTLYDGHQNIVNTNPLLFFSAIPIYCVMPDNITVNLRANYGNIIDGSLVFTVPIGYVINPDGSVDYNIPLDPNNNSDFTYNYTHLTPCVEGDIRPECQAEHVDLFSMLTSNMALGLYLCVILGIIGATFGGTYVGGGTFVIGAIFNSMYHLWPIWVGVVAILAVAGMAALLAKMIT